MFLQLFYSLLFWAVSQPLKLCGYQLEPIEQTSSDPAFLRAAYNVKKHRIIQQVTLRNREGSLALGGKTTTNLFRFRKQSKASTRLNVGAFNRVICVDAAAETVEVEGMTTYEALVEATLAHGFMPPVVPELKSITCGGAVSGIGIESSSFRYGFVHETVLEYEVLLSDGRVVCCTASNEHSDLFHGLPNSYGTLGYILKMTMRLVRVAPYVRVQHLRFTDPDEYFAELARVCHPTNGWAEGETRPDFVDGVSFSRDEHFLTLGTFAEALPADMAAASDYSYMGIYYKSIRERKTDYLTTKGYIWRWDGDWFWNSKYFLMQVPLIRFIFGRFCLKSTVFMKVFRAFQTSGLYDRNKRELVVQDVEIPAENARTFLDFYYDEVNYRNEIIACWVCPVRAFKKKTAYPLYRMDDSKLYVNFGFWDGVAVKDNTPDKVNKQIEAQVSALGGKKSLYSTGHYTRDDFWKEYNQKAYNKLRAKYDPDTVLLDLYDKCVKSS